LSAPVATRGERELVSAGALVLIAAAAVGLAVHFAFALGGSSYSPVVDDWLYCMLFAATSASCAWRAVRRPDERLPWAIAAVGVAVWMVAEVVYRVAETDPGAAYPPATRGLLVLAFLLAATTIAMLARRRVRSVETRLLLDGLIGGLAIAAVAAIPLFPGSEASAGAQPGPPGLFLLADLAILAFVMVVTGLTGWRPGWCWGLIAAGIVINTVGNAALVGETSAGTFERGGPVDSLFAASALTLGVAALFPLLPARVTQLDRRRLLGPAAFALVAVGVLGVAGLFTISPVAVALACATLVVLVARTLLAFGDNARLLERARREALTDALTGLGNRRRLARDFDVLTETGHPSAQRTLVLFDLDGFKAYNDAFGHPAGDALLSRLGASLGQAVSPHEAYRVGGDEFCVLVTGDRLKAEPLIAAGKEALVEHGTAFSITASYGAVSTPEEARTWELALQIADRRMYAHKDRRRTSAPAQTRAVLQQLLDERSPHTSDRQRELAGLVTLLGETHGLREPELDHLARAAELNDIGRAALPAEMATGDAAGAHDRALLAQHPLIAERILGAAPALAPVARIVRSSYERYDGNGYPDGLSGQDIPLEARIIAAGRLFLELADEDDPPSGRTLAALAAESGRRLDPFVVDNLHELAGELGLTEMDKASRRRVLSRRGQSRADAS
jgi:two-component system cell cycle response regulator